MVSVELVELIIDRVKTCGQSYDQIAENALLSKSTISRLVSKKTASQYTITQLVAFFELGEDYKRIMGSDTGHNSCALASDLFVEIDEMRSYYERKAAELRSHYEERLQLLRDQNKIQAEERERERKTQQETYKTNTDFLKSQIEKLERHAANQYERAVNAEARAAKAEEHSRSLDNNRHNVFWGMLVIIVLLMIAFVIALGTNKVF